VGLISSNDEKAYLEEFAKLSLSLMLNVSKTKELMLEFRRTQQHQRTYSPLGINGTTVERVSSFRYLGVHIAEDLTWTTHSGEEGEAAPLPPSESAASPVVPFNR